MQTAQKGDRVQVQYSRVRAHTASDTKLAPRKTFGFTVGSGEVFSPLSTGVIGMTPGGKRRLMLQPHEAYGEVRSTLIRSISRRRFPKNTVFEIGQRFTMVPGLVGARRRVTILEIRFDSVLVDGNHPLAGQSIELDVTLVSLVSVATTSGTY